ncbi:hypothetical protein [Streptomyces tubercidicus]|uniref:hypothetical protein n=1 Tax=Streptomyces tubercidicus TaxID=47759 RepID=UPI0022B7B3DF|nr:hypothetical protein [Streptomyces tubercidicus]WAU10006.1 hypothetical protein STRTU_000045 [Streptomyces tubercidicus]
MPSPTRALGPRGQPEQGRRLDDLRDRLASAEWYDDEEFAAYGLSKTPSPP